MASEDKQCNVCGAPATNEKLTVTISIYDRAWAFTSDKYCNDCLKKAYVKMVERIAQISESEVRPPSPKGT